MSRLYFCIDVITTSQIEGWIDDDGPVSAIDLEIDGVWACTLSPTVYRADLEMAGLGDGRRGFVFALAGRIGPDSVIAIKRHGAVLYQDRIAEAIDPNTISEARAWQRSQRRWRSDEPATSLTWGKRMTGDSLWDLYQSWHEFMPRERILEIGPGYGRLLRTALERRVCFSSYTGLDLSQARVDRLATEFSAHRIRFVQGDADNWRNGADFDAVICSSTFEHLYPDCRRALMNIHRQLSCGGVVFIDFIETACSARHFDAIGTYVREYSKEELTEIFAECGYTVVAVESCTLGEGNYGPVRRFVVFGKRD